jgi:Fic family protein
MKKFKWLTSHDDDNNNHSLYDVITHINLHSHDKYKHFMSNELLSTIYKSSTTEGSHMEFKTTEIITHTPSDELTSLNKMNLSNPKSQLYMRKEALQYNNAYTYTQESINDQTTLFPTTNTNSNEWFIQLHQTLMNGLYNQHTNNNEQIEVGKYRSNNVYTTIQHMLPEFVNDSMTKLVKDMNDMYELFKTEQTQSAKIEIACDMCATFMIRYLLIHPFSDGNGRISRIVGDYILQKCLNIDYYLNLTNNKKMRERYMKIVKYSNEHPIESAIQVMKEHVLYTLRKQTHRINNMLSQM